MISRRNLLRTGGGLATAAALAAGTGTFSAPVWGLPAPQWDRLRSSLQGSLVLPSDPGYDLAKQLQISSYDAINPQAIVYCTTPADVQTAVRFAQDNGVSVRVRSGGHNFSGWSTGTGIVVDLSRISHATLGTGTGTVHLGPGVKMVDALTSLAPYGKQVISGTCPTVCPGGFVQGGGIGYQSRKFGLAADQLVAATVVLADGRIVRASADEHPDLFWALRGGGGGNFGIAVDYEVHPVDAPRQVYYNVIWDFAKAADLFAVWQESLVTGSRNLGSSYVLVLPDADPANRPFVLLTGTYQGPQSELDAIIDGFASAVGAQPTSRVVKDGTYAEGQKNAYNCGDLTVDQCHRIGQTPGAALPRTPFQSEAYRFYNRRLAAGSVDDIVAAFDADRRAGQRRFLHCIGLGGRVGDVGRQETAFVHRDALYVMGYVAELDQPGTEADAAAQAWVDRGSAVLDPISSGAYVNFTSTKLPDWRRAYYGENYRALVAVKRTYDRNNFFTHPRSIGS